MDQLIGMLADAPCVAHGVAVVSDDASPSALCRTLSAARSVRDAGVLAAVGIRRGVDFTSQFRWVMQIGPESSDTVLLIDAQTREQTRCSVSQAIEQMRAL